MGDTVHKELEKALAERLTSTLPEALVVESAKQRFAVMLEEMRNSGTDDAALKQMISPEGFQKYLEVVRRQCEQQEADSGAAFNEEKAREKVTYELQRVAVLDEVRDQAKITYVDALSPEETARKMGID